MSKIRIKNFGPIKEGYQEDGGWMDVKKVTVFIGNQGSGKSTVAKLISTFMWIEKALVRGDYDVKWFSRTNKLRNQFLPYHRLENYLINENTIFDETIIEYIGDAYSIKYISGNLRIDKIYNNSYQLPQIMYVPAERNFISYVKSTKALKLSSDSLKEFLDEYDKAKNSLKDSIHLPINNTEIEYNKLNDIVYVKGKSYKIKLSDASSGFQSLVPLYIVSWFLSNSVKSQSEISKERMSSEETERFRKEVQHILDNQDLTDEQKRIYISELSKRFNKTAFINIIEEPEQNLFPNSQMHLLFKLLKFNNYNKENKLIMTTHSPYLVNYLTLAIKAKMIFNLNSKNSEIINKINKIVPIESIVNENDWIVFELNEVNGTITKLENYKDLPSDENYLNSGLEDSNELFAQLQEIEKGWR